MKKRFILLYSTKLPETVLNDPSVVLTTCPNCLRKNNCSMLADCTEAKRFLGTAYDCIDETEHIIGKLCSIPLISDVCIIDTKQKSLFLYKGPGNMKDLVTEYQREYYVLFTCVIRFTKTKDFREDILPYSYIPHIHGFVHRSGFR